MTGVRCRKISDLTEHEKQELVEDFGFNLEDATHICVIKKDQPIRRE